MKANFIALTLHRQKTTLITTELVHKWRTAMWSVQWSERKKMIRLENDEDDNIAKWNYTMLESSVAE